MNDKVYIEPVPDVICIHLIEPTPARYYSIGEKPNRNQVIKKMKPDVMIFVHWIVVLS